MTDIRHMPYQVPIQWQVSEAHAFQKVKRATEHLLLHTHTTEKYTAHIHKLHKTKPFQFYRWDVVAAAVAAAAAS